jgi:hypothetical protein
MRASPQSPLCILTTALALACGPGAEVPQPNAPRVEVVQAQQPPEAPAATTQPAATPTSDFLSAPPVPAGTVEGSVLTAAGLSFVIPEGWEQQTPSSSMRLAQLGLPGDAGAAEMTLFCFGPTQGGARQANIDRWVGQFSDPDRPGGAVESTVDTTEGTDGLTVTTVKAAGTLTTTSMGPFAPPQAPQPDQALFGAIVEGGPMGSVFVKVTGPKATLDAQDTALEAFLESLKRAE